MTRLLVIGKIPIAYATLIQQILDDSEQARCITSLISTGNRQEFGLMDDGDVDDPDPPPLSIPEGAFYTFTCKVESKYVRDVVESLSEAGAGRTFGYIDILRLETSLPFVKAYSDEPRKHVYRTDERSSLAEIHATIDHEIHLTFDFLMWCVIDAFVAALGILWDQSPFIVASLVISPLLFPIMGSCFGTIVRDFEMVRVSLRNLLIALLIMIGVGFIIGLLSFGILTRPTQSMLRFNTYASVVESFMIGIPGGAGLAIAISGSTLAPLVGIASAGNLVVPLVNLGIELALSLLLFAIDSGDSQLFALESLMRAFFAVASFLTNTLTIYIFGMIFFKIKQVRFSNTLHIMIKKD